MSFYSKNGYIAALKIRTNKSVLVEGKTEKLVLNRAIIELSQQIGDYDQPLIDSADILRDETLPPNNREKVEHIHSAATDKGISLMSLTDREFREFTVTSESIIDTLLEDFENDGMFWTRGHSIENYFFKQKYFTEALKSLYSEYISPQLINNLNIFSKGIIIEIASMSLAIMKEELISRCKNLCDKNYWMISSESLTIETNFLEKTLKSRGVPNEKIQSLLDLYKSLKTSCANSFSATDLIGIFHGHIGLDLLWSAVAAFASATGIQKNTLDSIASGHKDAKLRIFCDILAKDLASGSDNSTLHKLWPRIGLLIPTLETAAS